MKWRWFCFSSGWINIGVRCLSQLYSIVHVIAKPITFRHSNENRSIEEDTVSIINLFSVPRILFDQWTLNDYHIIFSSDTALQSLVDTIVSFLKVSSCNVCSVSCP